MGGWVADDETDYHTITIIIIIIYDMGARASIKNDTCRHKAVLNMWIIMSGIPSPICPLASTKWHVYLCRSIDAPLDQYIIVKSVLVLLVGS